MSLLLKNVSIIGVSRDFPERSDVLIKDNLISAIGNFPNKQAAEVIDAQGAYLAPGFIDVDASSDHYLSLFSDPAQEDFIKQGVTTIIGGHCGASLAPLLYGSLEAIRKWGNPQEINIDWHTLEEFFKVLDKRPLGVNFGTLVGHSTIRRALIGDAIRGLTKNELAVFKGILDRAQKEGALGMSFGLEYLHTRDTPWSELKEFALELAKSKRVFAVHARSIEEIARLAAETGASVFLNHIQPEDLPQIEGLNSYPNLHFSVYSLPGRVLPLYRFLPEWAQKENLDFMARNVKDTWMAKRILADLPELDPESVAVESSPANPELIGQTLAELMTALGIGMSREGLLELMRLSNLTAVISIKTMDADLLEKALLHERALVGSHAAAKIHYGAETLDRARARKTFTEYLKFMDQRGKFKEGVLRITHAPAEKFNLRGRGEVAEGAIADLVILRRDEICHVILGGKAILRDGQLTGVLNGKTLKYAE